MSLIDVYCKKFAPKKRCYNSSFKVAKKIKPTLDNANEVFVDSLLGITSNFRLPTSQNQTMQKMQISLIPYKRLHLFSVSQTFDIMKEIDMRCDPL